MKITNEVYDDIMFIRDTGLTNMFDVEEVKRLSCLYDMIALTGFLANKDNYRIYGEFILTGNRG